MTVKNGTHTDCPLSSRTMRFHEELVRSQRSRQAVGFQPVGDALLCVVHGCMEVPNGVLGVLISFAWA